MVKVSVIGTAGRKDDIHRLSVSVFLKMFADLKATLLTIAEKKDLHLVSGGAAWADHLAVFAYLCDLCEKLTLYFPADFKSTGFIAATNSKTDPGSIANYYHGLFSRKLGRNSIEQLQKAIDNGAEVVVNPGGFLARNFQVAQSDVIVAYTFSNGDSPKADSGTYHTWSVSKAPKKIHRNILVIKEQQNPSQEDLYADHFQPKP